MGREPAAAAGSRPPTDATRSRARPSGSRPSTSTNRRSSPAPGLDQGGPRQLPGAGPRELLHVARGDRATLIERYQHTGVDAAGALARHPDGAQGRADPAPADRPRSSSSTPAATHVEVEDFVDLVRHTIILPKSHGRLGGKSSGLFLAAQILRRSRRVAGRAAGRPGAARPGTCPPTASCSSSPTTTSTTSTTGSTATSTRSGRSTPTSCRSSRAPASPRDRERALSRRSTTSASARSSCAARACSRTASGSAFSGKYKSLFLANQGSKAGAPRRAPRRGGRGLRVGLQPRPDRVPGRARAPGPARGDGAS